MTAVSLKPVTYYARGSAQAMSITALVFQGSMYILESLIYVALLQGTVVPYYRFKYGVHLNVGHCFSTLVSHTI